MRKNTFRVSEASLDISANSRIWREKNKKFELEPTISDMWTPGQREKFLRDWFKELNIMEASCGEKHTYDEMMNEGVLQTGRGEKRSQDDEDNERPFYIESVTQVNTKKFRTTAMNYRVRFTNALADVEITNLHQQLHETIQQILDKTIGGVRVIQSNQQFRLNDTFDVNVIHVSMPSGGKGSKRSEVNLEKHLEKKK